MRVQSADARQRKIIRMSEIFRDAEKLHSDDIDEGTIKFLTIVSRPVILNLCFFVASRF